MRETENSASKNQIIICGSAETYLAYICSGDRVGVLQSHLQYLVSADSTCVIIVFYQWQLICIIIQYNYIIVLSEIM